MDDVYLDGKPEDFPEREAAMEEYRALWFEFLRGASQEFLPGCDRRFPTNDMMLRMDVLQTKIARGPGPVWKGFAASMPGYLEWWEGAYDDAMTAFRKQFPEHVEKWSGTLDEG